MKRFLDERTLLRAHLRAIAAIHSFVSRRERHFLGVPRLRDPVGARAQLTSIFERLARQFRLVVIDLCYDLLLDGIDLKWVDGFYEKNRRQWPGSHNSPESGVRGTPICALFPRRLAST
jgi:hypothetical protein